MREDGTAAAAAAAADGHGHGEASRAGANGAAGGVAGAVAKSMWVVPLERLRALASLGRLPPAALSLRALRTGRVVFKEEVAGGLRRGDFGRVLRAFPTYGVLFGCNDMYKTMLAQALLEDADRRFGRTGLEELPFWLNFTSGAMAGLTAEVATYPLHESRARSAQTRAGLSTTPKGAGLRSWFKAVMSPALARSVPYEGIRFAVYDLAMNAQTEHFGVDPKRSVMAKLVSGAAAGFTAGVILYPFDMALVVSDLESRKKPTSLAQSCMLLYRQNGVKQFFVGVWPNVLRATPESAVQFAVHSMVIDALLT